MTRIFTDGAEIGDTLFWSTVGSATNVTTTPRSGSRCYQMGATESRRTITAVSEGYYRIGFRFSTAGAHVICRWRAGATELGSIRLNASTLKLEAYNTSSNLAATGTAVLSASTWYLIEVHIKIADAGNIDVRVEGNTTADIAFSGDTKPGADTTFDSLNLTMANVGGTQLVDDLAFNDTAGGADNSWCGDGKIVMISPNGVGDSTQLTPSSGSNWQCVDEVPPNSDTDYVESATAGQYDLYNLGSIALGAGDTILRVWVEGRVRETVAAGDNVQLGVKSSATEDWSVNLPVTTSYARYVGDDLTQDPATTAAWTESGVNSLQAGMKVI